MQNQCTSSGKLKRGNRRRTGAQAIIVNPSIDRSGPEGPPSLNERCRLSLIHKRTPRATCPWLTQRNLVAAGCLVQRQLSAQCVCHQVCICIAAGDGRPCPVRGVGEEGAGASLQERRRSKPAVTPLALPVGVRRPKLQGSFVVDHCIDRFRRPSVLGIAIANADPDRVVGAADAVVAVEPCSLLGSVNLRKKAVGHRSRRSSNDAVASGCFGIGIAQSSLDQPVVISADGREHRRSRIFYNQRNVSEKGSR